MALGGNLPGGHPSVEALLREALTRFGPAGLQLNQVSSFWRSTAWPDPSAPPYLNGVAIVETELAPEAVLQALLGIERSFGRERGQPNAPRTLDLDLIDYDGLVLDRPGLRLPHPRAHERLFVMGPLAEIEPDWRHPVHRATAAELERRAPIGRDARPDG